MLSMEHPVSLCLKQAQRNMKFTVSSSDLSSRLQTINKVQNSKNTLIILDCILFELSNGTLRLTGSDSEITVHSTIEVSDIEGEGVIAIDAKRLINAVKEIPEQPIIIEADTNTLAIKITYQNGEYSFMGSDGTDYPLPIPLDTYENTVTINSQKMYSGITRCLYAAADDELRPQMNGVFFDMSNNVVTFVATDGHKMVRNRLYTVHPESSSSFILPKKPALVLKNVLQRYDEDATVSFDQTNAKFEVENYTLVCRLAEGRYPNYDSVIPNDNPFHVRVDRSALVSSLRRILVFASQSCAVVKVHIEQGTLTISSQDLDFSTSAEERLLCEYDGTPMSIGFNGPFLMEVLNCISTEDVILELADPSRPGLVTPADMDEEENLIMLLMPMLIK